MINSQRFRMTDAAVDQYTFISTINDIGTHNCRRIQFCPIDLPRHCNHYHINTLNIHVTQWLCIVDHELSRACTQYYYCLTTNPKNLYGEEEERKVWLAGLMYSSTHTKSHVENCCTCSRHLPSASQNDTLTSHCQSVCAGKYSKFLCHFFAEVNSLTNETIAYECLQGQDKAHEDKTLFDGSPSWVFKKAIYLALLRLIDYRERQ